MRALMDRAALMGMVIPVLRRAAVTVSWNTYS